MNAKSRTAKMIETSKMIRTKLALKIVNKIKTSKLQSQTKVPPEITKKKNFT